MSKASIVGSGLMALMATVGFAGDQGAPSCCRKPAVAGQTAQAEKMQCSLTGKVVDKCCCVQRESKTHCTLADKDVATCCCKPVKGDSKQASK